MSLSSIPHNEEVALSDQPAPIAPNYAAKSYLILSLILTIFAIAPLFYPGYIQTHSGFVLVWNVTDLRANLGTWLWLPHVATSFDPLRSDGLWPYYLAGILPFEANVAIKVVFGLGWVLGSAGIFLWLKNWLGPPGALIAALVYTYLPYQIAAVYVRGAWGEVFFWGLLPWAILAATGEARRRGDRANHHSSLLLSLLGILIWLALGLNQLGLTFWAFVFVSLLLVATRHSQSVRVILVNFVGVALATFITLTISASATPPSNNFFDHFLYPFQLLSAYWGFGSSRPGWNDGMSFQLGLAAVGLSILSLILWQRRALIGRTDPRLIFFSSTAIVSIMLQFGLTEPLWHLPLLPGYSLAGTLTYPWQLSGLTGLCLAVLAGASLRLDEQLTRWPLFSSIIILVILSSYSYLTPQFIQIEPETKSGPQAVLGPDQIALIAYSFSVQINGNTAGLEQGPTTIPLKAHGPLRAGEKLELEVTWQLLQSFNEDWKIFVHLVEADGHVVAQFDGQPLEGTYPTSHWIPGELVKDSYPLLLPPDGPPGPYRVFLGLYNESSSARLPVPGDTEGRVILNVE